jgi:hypothetical protein
VPIVQYSNKNSLFSYLKKAGCEVPSLNPSLPSKLSGFGFRGYDISSLVDIIFLFPGYCFFSGGIDWHFSDNSTVVSDQGTFNFENVYGKEATIKHE